ncbi:hypothetical protein ABK01_08215 [Treponema sp. OMZ 305]|uniref:hypothetical protein n=1 Tax=Treponema sp. OMZ 305 TaxID=1659192 RepID=UPI0020A3A270|nr:hypothetical protein [Treponema sp. OMZ 305]UTC58248.1 hypothetical protein ABK01_08215 [Treponema sp. OMZ 305]
MKILLTFFYLSAATLLFGGESTVLYRQIVNVKALSNGAEKTIYSTIDKETAENRVMLIVTALPSGDIEIRSDKFKLGKMPFSSFFQFIIPHEEIIQNADGAYIIDGLTGIYKVAMSKPQAFLTGTLSHECCNLTLAVDGMGKKLSMQFYSVRGQTFDNSDNGNKEDKISQNEENTSDSSTAQN